MIFTLLWHAYLQVPTFYTRGARYRADSPAKNAVFWVHIKSHGIPARDQIHVAQANERYRYRCLVLPGRHRTNVRKCTISITLCSLLHTDSRARNTVHAVNIMEFWFLQHTASLESVHDLQFRTELSSKGPQPPR